MATGIQCPHCNAVDDYAGKQNIKSEGKITRRKQCKNCNGFFETIEVLVGPIEVRSRKKTETQQAEPPTQPQTQ